MPPCSKYQTQLNNFWKAYYVRDGWDGGTAPQPLAVAKDHARLFLELVYSYRERQLIPVHISPIIDGGLGFLYKYRETCVIVEFSNDGDIVALFSKGAVNIAKELTSPSELQLLGLVQEAQDFIRRG